MSVAPTTTPQQTRVIFFGNERIATGVTTHNPVLLQLIDKGYDIAAIVVNNEEQRGTHKVRELEIASVAAEHSIPLLAPIKLSDASQQLRNYKADVAILVAYGKIVPQTIIDIFPHGIINIHPSLLPKHRGPIPLESVVLEGESETGVSLMQLAQEMDAGPIYAQSKLALSGNEQKQALADQLLDIAAAMLSDLLPEILAGSIIAIPQEHSLATYDTRLTKQDGMLDWNKPAKRLAREIRAFAEWPKSRTTLGSIEVIITAAHASTETHTKPAGTIEIQDNASLRICCNEGYLYIDELKPAGKQAMDIAAFIRGYSSRLNS